MTDRQKRAKKDEEHSGVSRRLVGRRGTSSQTKGHKQLSAAAWWGSPLMSAPCLHHTNEVMISRPPRQKRFPSFAAANTCGGRHQVRWHLHHVVKDSTTDRESSRGVLSNTYLQHATTTGSSETDKCTEQNFEQNLAPACLVNCGSPPKVELLLY